MKETSSAWQSRANVPQGDPSMIQLIKEMQSLRRTNCGVHNTSKLLVRNQLRRQANAMDSIQGTGCNSMAIDNQYQSQERIYFAQGFNQDGDFQE